MRLTESLPTSAAYDAKMQKSPDIALPKCKKTQPQDKLSPKRFWEISESILGNAANLVRQRPACLKTRKKFERVHIALLEYNTALLASEPSYAVILNLQTFIKNNLPWLMSHAIIGPASLSPSHIEVLVNNLKMLQESLEKLFPSSKPDQKITGQASQLEDLCRSILSLQINPVIFSYPRRNPFNQEDIFPQLQAPKYKDLLEIKEKYKGLCEIICNRLLIDNVLGNNGESRNAISDYITADRLNEYVVKESHILNVYSIPHLVMAGLFGIYPDNVFSCFDQWKLVKVTYDPEYGVTLRSVNRKLLAEGLQKLPNDTTLKLQVFEKSGQVGLTMQGHSLLIKKLSNDKYIFFDPSSGEHRDLSLKQLGNKINEQLLIWGASDIFIMKGSDFLKKF